ncbi:hypothetical protein A2U01_0091724, partial [Trifolium medium]|nr:hypothetical protein [Trifolium medium]
KQSLKAKDADLLALKTEMATNYLEGFDFTVAQAKVAIPSEHHEYLKEINVVKVIHDGHLVDQAASVFVKEDPAGSDVAHK